MPAATWFSDMTWQVITIDSVAHDISANVTLWSPELDVEVTILVPDATLVGLADTYVLGATP